jgi:hypothetical protein
MAVSPNLKDIFGDVLPKKIELPQPKIPREEQQIQYMREIEIDPNKYYPEDVYRDPETKLDNPLIIDLEKMLKSRQDDENKE